MIRAWATAFLVSVCGAAQAELRVVSASGEPYLPVVGAGGQTTAVYTAAMMLDGDPDTFACLLDDSRGGARSDTRPPRGDAPVTGAITLDLGGEYEVDGVEFVSRNNGGRFLPREVEILGIKFAFPPLQREKPRDPLRTPHA
jgi:hypothetical protein